MKIILLMALIHLEVSDIVAFSCVGPTCFHSQLKSTNRRLAFKTIATRKTALNAIPEDFASGKIKGSLPLRGFPMPAEPGDEVVVVPKLPDPPQIVEPATSIRTNGINDFSAGKIMKPLPLRGLSMPEETDEAVEIEKTKEPESKVEEPEPKAAPEPDAKEELKPVKEEHKPEPEPVKEDPKKIPTPEPEPIKEEPKPTPEPKKITVETKEVLPAIPPIPAVIDTPVLSVPSTSSQVADPSVSNGGLSISIPTGSLGAVPLLLIPFAALLAGRQVLSSRDVKQKEIEKEIALVEEKRRQELDSLGTTAISLFAIAFLSLAAALISFGGITFAPSPVPIEISSLSQQVKSSAADVTSESNVNDRKLYQSTKVATVSPRTNAFTRSSNKAIKSNENVDDSTEKLSTFDSVLANLEKASTATPEPTTEAIEGETKDEVVSMGF